MLRDAAAVVGIGQTEFAPEIDRPLGQLAAEAVVAARRDVGIAPSEVDGLSSFTTESTDEVTLAQSIGAGDVTCSSQVGYGGGAGCATIGHAALRSPPGRRTSSWPGARASGGARGRGPGPRGTSTSQVDGARTCLVTSGECVPTGAVLPRVPERAMIARA